MSLLLGDQISNTDFRPFSCVYVNNFDARWHWIQNSCQVSNNKGTFQFFMLQFPYKDYYWVQCLLWQCLRVLTLACDQCPRSAAKPLEAAPQCSQCRNFRKRTVLILIDPILQLIYFPILDTSININIYYRQGIQLLANI